MGKLHVNHRIVLRDRSGKIVEDTEAASFAEGFPIYEQTIARLQGGQTVCLQHGARIVFEADEAFQEAD